MPQDHWLPGFNFEGPEPMTWKAENRPFPNVNAFAARLRKLHAQRKANKRKGRREALTKAECAEILTKTGGRCDICGGMIKRRRSRDDSTIGRRITFWRIARAASTE
jgi:hypothetical protein